MTSAGTLQPNGMLLQTEVRETAAERQVSEDMHSTRHQQQQDGDSAKVTATNHGDVIKEQLEVPSLNPETTSTNRVNGTLPEVFDSALLAAMRDPRERVGLLRLEQNLIEFIKEDTEYVDVGGHCNSALIRPGDTSVIKDEMCRQTSFQRCCLHRLADRFQIKREATVDGWIRLVKIELSSVPKKLLIDLEPSEYELDDTLSMTQRLQDTRLSTKLNKPRKMKIMKRSSSSFDSSGSQKDGNGKSAARGRKNLSDKEKAYAEARARIFSETGDSTTAAAPTTIDVKPTPVVPSPEPSAGSVSPLLNGEEDNKGISKVTWRNRRQEESDPDFQRGVPIHEYAPCPVYLAPAPAYPAHYFAASPYGTNGAGSFVPMTGKMGNGYMQPHGTATGASYNSPGASVNPLPYPTVPTSPYGGSTATSFVVANSGSGASSPYVAVVTSASGAPASPNAANTSSTHGMSFQSSNYTQPATYPAMRGGTRSGRGGYAPRHNGVGGSNDQNRASVAVANVLSMEEFPALR